MKEIEIKDEDLALMLKSKNNKAIANELGVAESRITKEKERLIKEGYDIPNLRGNKKKLSSLKRKPFVWELYKRLKEEYG